MSDPITDAELIRYLDGELTAIDKAAIDASPEASARLNALRRRSSRLSDLLVAVNPESDEVRSSADRIRPELEYAARRRFVLSAPLKAAALIVLFLGFALAVPPVRATLFHWARQALFAIGVGAPAVQPAAPAPAPARPAAEPAIAAFSVQFDVTADTFDILHSLTAGELIIQQWTEPRGLAEVAGNSDADIVLLPRGARLAGPASPTTVYTIKLPARTTAVRIQGEGTPTRMLVLSNSQPVRISLGEK